jgi:hypothetical protein
MGEVAELAIKHDGTAEVLVSSLVVVTFGTRHGRSQPGSLRHTFVEELRQRLGSSLKIVHGMANGHFGNFGGHKRFAYTFLVPKFDAVLGRLGQIEFGTVEELTPN